MALLARLQASGCRIDGLNYTADGTISFVATPAGGAWTDAEKNAVLAALGRTPVAISPAGLCNQVDAYRDQRLAAGYVDATTGKTYQCNAISVGRWTALAMQAFIAISAGTTPAPSFDVITADNSEITLSEQDCYALFSARVAPWVQATIFYARAMKNNILASNPPADITEGWP
jgi:hypothetical protein